MENRITGHTKLYCLIGSPVGHSGSPAMYNYSFAAQEWTALIWPLMCAGSGGKGN